MHDLIKSQIQNLNNFNFHYILIILIKFPSKCNDCFSGSISKTRRLEEKQFLLHIISEMVNRLWKAEKKDNEKQNESEAKMNVLPAREIYDCKTQLNVFYSPKNMWFKSTSQTKPGTRLQSTQDVPHTRGVWVNILWVGTEMW